MTYQEEEKLKLIHSLRGIVLSRWFLIIGLGFVGVIQRIVGVGVTSLTPERLIALVIFPIVYNLVFSLYIRRKPEQLHATRLHILSILQVVVDIVMITLVVHYTGGVESVNFIIYFFPLLTATILFTSAEFIALAVLTVAVYSGYITAEFGQLVTHHTRYQHDSGIFGNLNATLLNTMTIDLTIILLSALAMFVNKIIRDRESQITIERDKVRSILDSLDDGIILLDNNHRILSMNPPARAMLRLYDDGQTDVLDKKQFPSSFSKLISAILAQPNKKKLAQEVVIDDNGNNTYIHVDAIPIYGAQEQVIAWVKVLHDNTREKELDQVKSDFISIAAHQLRTPIAGLKWFFQLMLDGDTGKLNKKQQELLQQASEKSEQVMEIINNLLDVSEIEQGRSPYAFTERHVTDVLDEVVSRSQLDAQRKQIQLVYEKNMDHVMPPAMVDPEKLKMALQNLVDNAMKYSSEGKSVVVKYALKNNRHFISVTDSGIGISKKEQKQIFTKFYRASNAKELVSSGSGLGLYIVKNIIQKHGGQIWFESEGMNKGTTFYLTIPIPRQYL